MRAKSAGTDLGCASENYAAGSSTIPDSILSDDMDISSSVGVEMEFKVPSLVTVDGIKPDLAL